MQIVHRLPSSGLLGQWRWAAAVAWLSHRTEHDNPQAAAHPKAMPTAQHRAQRTETMAELVYSVAFGPPELRRAACRRNHRRDETGSAENVARAHAIWRA